MNRRMVLSMVGKVVLIEAALMLPALITSIIYKESCVTAFAVSMGICLAVGALLTVVFKPSSNLIFAREGFVIVALCWIALSALGALPFYISREIPSYIDAFFETVSGFSTTGASILADVEAMSRGLLFWRSFTQWIGGMGVLVFVLAVVNTLSDRSIHILRAEMPGPVVGKLVPKARKTARLLYVIYIVFTLAEILLLWAGDMSLFDSILHAMGTASTGGFGIRPDSVAAYSTYSQIVISVFMLLFGINFNLYYFILIGKAKISLKSTELHYYLGTVAFSTVCIMLNLYPVYKNIGTSLRHAFFQVSGFITTTCFSTDDFNGWPVLSKTILFILMFVGGCAGSTAGGFKISRAIILVKSIKREFKRALHPRSVEVVNYEGKKLGETTVNAISSYLSIYVLFFCVIVLLIGFEDFSLETNLTAVATCYNNIGHAFGATTSVFAGYSPFGKFLLCAAMLFGRLEIYPMIIALSPSTWSKK